MDESKKLDKKNKEMKLLNQILNEHLETITKEKEHIVKKNQNLKYEKLKLEESSKNLIKENEALNDKNHKLITELDKVKPFVEKFTYNSEKLKTILNNQQVVFDKIGLGFRRIFK